MIEKTGVEVAQAGSVEGKEAETQVVSTKRTTAAGTAQGQAVLRTYRERSCGEDVLARARTLLGTCDADTVTTAECATAQSILAADWDSASLDAVRQRIDALDILLLDILNARAECSLAVGKIKADNGGAVLQPARERAVLARVLAHNDGPLPQEHIEAVYREVFSSSRALQRPIRVSYLGPEGTFSYMAGVEFFGSSCQFMAADTFADIFRSVQDGLCDLGVVPLENSLYGTVGQSVDLFAAHTVHIQAEWFSRIQLSLLSRVARLEDITTVYSHAQPLGQSAQWLQKHLPGVRQVHVESTAAAGKLAASQPGAAAIGHAGLAERFGLAVLFQGIEDISDNWTRFCAIGKAPGTEATANKSSVLFSLADKPGSLAAMLHLFGSWGINLSKLESRPIPSERWHYMFFADLGVNLYQPKYEQLLQEAQTHCHILRVLGAYPAGESCHGVL